MVHAYNVCLRLLRGLRLAHVITFFQTSTSECHAIVFVIAQQLLADLHDAVLHVQQTAEAAHRYDMVMCMRVCMQGYMVMQVSSLLPSLRLRLHLHLQPVGSPS